MSFCTCLHCPLFPVSGSAFAIVVIDATVNVVNIVSIDIAINRFLILDTKKILFKEVSVSLPRKLFSRFFPRLLNNVDIPSVYVISVDIKGLENRVKIVLTVTMVATVLFGGFVIPSVYAKVNTFTSEFETTKIFTCSNEPIIFGGTIHFDIKEEENGLESAHVHYSNVHGVGFQTGTKYVVHENDQYDTVLNKNGDTMFSTLMHGSVTGGGSIDNTRVDITFINVVHPDGTVTVLVEETKITCTG